MLRSGKGALANSFFFFGGGNSNLNSGCIRTGWKIFLAFTVALGFPNWSFLFLAPKYDIKYIPVFIASV